MQWASTMGTSAWKSAARLPVFSKPAIDPPDRDSSGSLAIEHLSRAEAQPGPPGRLQAGLCRGAGDGPPLEGLAPGTRCRAARPRPRWPGRGWSPSRSLAGSSAKGSNRRQLRDHLPLHLRPDPPHQRRGLAQLPAQGQVQARPARQARLPRQLHQRPYSHCPAPRGRPAAPDLRPLGSRSHALRRARPGHPGGPRTQVPPPAVGQAARQAAHPAADQLIAWFQTLDRRLRKTITFDNGTEFAQHHVLADELGIRTFFCGPARPWEEGAVENDIGRLRRPLPRSKETSTHSAMELLEASSPPTTTRRESTFAVQVAGRSLSRQTVALRM